MKRVTIILDSLDIGVKFYTNNTLDNVEESILDEMDLELTNLHFKTVEKFLKERGFKENPDISIKTLLVYDEVYAFLYDFGEIDPAIRDLRKGIENVNKLWDKYHR